MPFSPAEAKRKQPRQKASPPPSAQAQPTTLPSVIPGLIQRAAGVPPQLLAGDLLYLQRTVGNRAVGQMLSGGGNLRVGPANDRYEQEAEGVAQQVSSHAEKVQRAPALVSSVQPRIQREQEKIKFQGKSKSIAKGDQEQFKQSIGKMSSKGVEPVAVNQRPKAVMLMGAAGAGKSSIIDQLVPDRSNFVHADADQVKEAMPEYQRGVKAGDKNIANTVHARSKDVTKFVATQAIAGRRNLLFDATGNNTAEYMALITAMRQKNYQITLAMVHISPDEGVKRVAERARQTGREIPENVVRDMYHWVPRNFPTLANLVDHAYLFNNMVPQGQPPFIVWETSDGTNLQPEHLDYVLELLAAIEGQEIDNAAPEDENYVPPLVPLDKARYLQEGGTSRWQKETTKKKKGFAVSRKHLSEVDESLKLYRLYKSKNRGNAEEQAKLLKSLESSITKSSYQGGNIKVSMTHLRRRNAMNHLREELKGEYRRNALRLARIANDKEQVDELVKVGLTADYLKGLLKMDVKRLYEAHVALAFGQKDLAQKAFDKLNPVEREQTGELKYSGHYVKRSRDRLHFAQQILTAHHHETIGGEYSRTFAPGDIDEQRMGEITTNYLRNPDFLGGVVQDVKTPYLGAKLKTLVPTYAGILSRQELEAIRVYTSSTYKHMNATMQDIRLDDPETQTGFKGYSSLSQVAVSALSKLPSYAGPMLYRGDGNFGGVAEVARIGASFRTPSFMSTSKSTVRAANFGTSVAWIVLPAPNSSGKDIQAISTARPEEEVLFPPGVKMQVVDVIRGPQKSTIAAGEKPAEASPRILKSWKTDSGKPIPPAYLDFMVKFRAARNTLIILQEVK